MSVETSAIADGRRRKHESGPELNGALIIISRFGIQYGRFVTAKGLVLLVLQCLDAFNLITIHKFFQKSWTYIDAYK